MVPRLNPIADDHLAKSRRQLPQPDQVIECRDLSIDSDRLDRDSLLVREGVEGGSRRGDNRDPIAKAGQVPALSAQDPFGGFGRSQSEDDMSVLDHTVLIGA